MPDVGTNIGPFGPSSLSIVDADTELSEKVYSPAGMILPCQRTSCGSVNLPAQRVCAAAVFTQALTASNPNATIAKKRLRFVLMMNLLPRFDFSCVPYALPLGVAQRESS
jgi:hypothetical protein